MSKHVYISADYAPNDGDQEVIDVLHSWGSDNKHKTDFIDTAQVVSGSITKNPDCRPCDLKREFNAQINASSAVIFIIGDRTSSRTAGSTCGRIQYGAGCGCTPYKQNVNGRTYCKVTGSVSTPGPDEDYGPINPCSYLKHEFMQAVKKEKEIVIVYNSVIRQPQWLPSYMKGYEEIAHPFWKRNYINDTVGDYQFIKQALGYE